MICLVTDRHRLAPAGAGPAVSLECLTRQVQYAVEAGIDLVQLRERDLEGRELAELTVRLLAVTRGTSTRLIVNDRLDVALACGADGVHLRGDSIPVHEARRIAPGRFLITRSVHTVEEAAASAVGADALLAGTVFRSPSKAADAPLIGVDGLGAIVKAVGVPVLAIGGVDAATVERIAAAGAAGFAAIGVFMGSHPDAQPGGCHAADLRQTVKKARSVFDTPYGTP